MASTNKVSIKDELSLTVKLDNEVKQTVDEEYAWDRAASPDMQGSENASACLQLATTGIKHEPEVSFGPDIDEMKRESGEEVEWVDGGSKDEDASGDTLTVAPAPQQLPLSAIKQEEYEFPQTMDTGSDPGHGQPPMEQPGLRSHLNPDEPTPTTRTPAPNAYQCLICQKLFSHKRILRRHMSTHPEEEMMKPPLQPAQPPALPPALPRALPAALKGHQCQICHKLLSQKWILRRHMGTHSEEEMMTPPALPRALPPALPPKLPPALKAHQCPICHKLLSQKWILRRHMGTHSEEEIMAHANNATCYVLLHRLLM